MVKTEVRQMAFSFDQPDNLLLLLRQAIEPALAQGMSHHFDAARILIIDTRADKAHYLAQFLLSKGFASRVTANGLDAFTLFLRREVVPLVIILSQEPEQDRFFLQRLTQQMSQRYGCVPSLVRLPASALDRLASQTTGPLSPWQAARESLAQTTDPLAAVSRLAPQTTEPLPIRQTSTSLNALVPSALGATGAAEVKKVSLEGQNFGRYQILSRIGEGSWSAVYRAYDRLREQDIALKAIQTNTVPYFQLRGALEEENFFQREKELLATVKHPHILPLPNCGKSYVSGSSFIYKTMPYYAAGSLANWLTARVGVRYYEPREVLAVVLPLADALHYVHDRHIMHQNFKLSNLLITNEAHETDDLRQLQVTLCDFAITQDGRFFSKTADNFPFIAPEQWQGRSCAASDQYALAVIAYRLLAGRFPFLGDGEALLQRMHMMVQPQPMSRFNLSVSPALDEVILHALLKRPEQRFPSVANFASAFESCCK